MIFIERWGLAGGSEDCGLVNSGRTGEKGLAGGSEDCGLVDSGRTGEKGLAGGSEDCGLVNSGRTREKGLKEIGIGRRFHSETVQGKKEWKKTWCCAWSLCSFCAPPGPTVTVMAAACWVYAYKAIVDLVEHPQACTHVHTHTSTHASMHVYTCKHTNTHIHCHKVNKPSGLFCLQSVYLPGLSTSVDLFIQLHQNKKIA